MATASIQQRHLSSKRKPEPSRVVQSYLHIVDTQGKRGALRKTGEIYGIAGESVRRYVAAHEAAQNVPEQPPELQYVPPPGGYPEPQAPHIAAAIGTDTAQNDVDDSAKFMSSVIRTNEAETQETTNGTAEHAQQELAHSHTDELETLAVTMPETTQPLVRERVITRIVRLPVETRQHGFYDRLAGLQVESIMGPELGLIVAVILIAMTFWGLG
jgi:CxxC motif-containing protein